jgi:hypothetical protein
MAARKVSINGKEFLFTPGKYGSLVSQNPTPVRPDVMKTRAGISKSLGKMPMGTIPGVKPGKRARIISSIRG